MEAAGSAVDGCPVQVRTLGRFAVEVSGTPLPTGPKAQAKPLALLKLLIALGGDGVHRQVAAEALWPDADGDLGLASLSTNLTRLRKLIGREAVTLHNERLALAPQHCWVDALAFAELLAEAERAGQGGDDDAAWQLLQQALPLYGGPFLDGEFDPPEILTARDRLHGLFLRHIGRLGAVFQECGDPARALALYHKGLDTDPLAEELYQQAMRCHLEQGRIAEGIAVYRRCRDVLSGSLGIAPGPETESLHDALRGAQRERPTEGAGPRPAERPSIAVLAFANLSGDAEQEYFCDGISEDIITDLSKLAGLVVIGRSSSFAYKGRVVDLRQVGRELGVRYVLKGSVRRRGDHVRVTAQLAEAETGHHVWAERYDREANEAYVLGDEITEAIVTALDVRLLSGEAAHVWRKALRRPEARERFYEGSWVVRNPQAAEIGRARHLFEQVAELEPESALGYSWVAMTHCVDLIHGWSADRSGSLVAATAMSQEGIARDSTQAVALSALGLVQLFRHEQPVFLDTLERAVYAKPACPGPKSMLAYGQLYAGQWQLALHLLIEAERLDPLKPAWYHYLSAMGLLIGGRAEEALDAVDGVLSQAPNLALAHGLRIAVLGELHRFTAAADAAANLRRLSPDFTVARYAATQPFQDPARSDWLAAHLLTAGVPR